MLYTSEFAQKLKRAYFSQRIKIAHRQVQRRKQKRKDRCGHDFQYYSPFIGCAKMVCVFCAEESPEKVFRNSVYAYKGSTFVKNKK